MPMENQSNLKLYNLQTNKIQDMPIDDVGPLIGSSISAKIIRQIVLQEQMSKFFGFLCSNDSISKILAKTGLANKINADVAATYKQYNYSNLNKAFIHRRNRNLFPLVNEVNDDFTKKILSSPADSYLNIRKIEKKKINLYPELSLDLKKMVGEENASMFENGGRFLLFTLKPFHDHTMDYPFNSQVINTPIELNKSNKVVYSTDLNFARFISDYQNKSIFDENHRVVTKLLAKDFDEEYLYIEVGAINVNSIEQDNCDLQKSYKRGEQKSHFNFGSTIILLLPKSFDEKLFYPEIFLQNENTSVAIKRRNIIAVSKACHEKQSFSISENVKMILYKNSEGKIGRSEIFRN